MRIGIIGATGWLGSALGGRLLAQGIVAPENLIALNRTETTITSLCPARSATSRAQTTPRWPW